jgi:hypothetical protein
MPRYVDPPGYKRYTTRFPPEDAALVELAAEQAGLAVSGLIRECAVRYGFQVARDRLAGKAVHIRAANGRPREHTSRAEKERKRAVRAEIEPPREAVSADEAFRLAAERRIG